MEEVLVIDQRDPAAQKTVKVRSPAATPLTAARLAKKYAKFAGSPDFVLTRPSGARLAAGDAVPSTVFVEAADDRVCRFCYDGAAEDAALVAAYLELPGGVTPPATAHSFLALKVLAAMRETLWGVVAEVSKASALGDAEASAYADLNYRKFVEYHAAFMGLNERTDANETNEA